MWILQQMYLSNQTVHILQLNNTGKVCGLDENDFKQTLVEILVNLEGVNDLYLLKIVITVDVNWGPIPEINQDLLEKAALFKNVEDFYNTSPYCYEKLVQRFENRLDRLLKSKSEDSGDSEDSEDSE